VDWQGRAPGSLRFIVTGGQETDFRLDGSQFAWDLGGQITYRYQAGGSAWALDAGSLVGGLDAAKDIPPHYWVLWAGFVPIPVYLRGTIEGAGELDLGVTGFAADEWQFAGVVLLEGGGKIIPGLGIADFLAFELQFGVKAEAEFAFPQQPWFRDGAICLSGSARAVRHRRRGGGQVCVCL
jgi:hypothetical protein